MVASLYRSEDASSCHRYWIARRPRARRHAAGRRFRCNAHLANRITLWHDKLERKSFAQIKWNFMIVLQWLTPLKSIDPQYFLHKKRLSKEEEVGGGLYSHKIFLQIKTNKWLNKYRSNLYPSGPGCCTAIDEGILCVQSWDIQAQKALQKE